MRLSIILSIALVWAHAEAYTFMPRTTLSRGRRLTELGAFKSSKKAKGNSVPTVTGTGSGGVGVGGAGKIRGGQSPNAKGRDVPYKERKAMKATQREAKFDLVVHDLPHTRIRTNIHTHTYKRMCAVYKYTASLYAAAFMNLTHHLILLTYTHTLQPIDKLENTLLGKYGSSSGTSTYQNGEDEEKHSNAHVKRPRFDGFMPRQRQQQQQQQHMGVGVCVGVGSHGGGSQGSQGSESTGDGGSGAGGEEEGREGREVRGQIPCRFVRREGATETGMSTIARLPVNDDDDHEGFEDIYGDGGMDDDDGHDCWSRRYVDGDTLVGRARGVGVGVWRAKVRESDEGKPSFRLRRPKVVDPRTAAAAARKANRSGKAECVREKRKKRSPTVEGKWSEFR
jgi:hypothetical protein